jgi:cytidine deaminase
MASDDLLQAALKARAHAHAPYSGFPVGAALRATDGTVHAGCNVENAAFPQGQCAEATAIGVMIAAGSARIAEILVAADGPETVTPCGGCRQRLVEFADPATPVHLAGPEGVRATVTLGELLPRAFGWRRVISESKP